MAPPSARVSNSRSSSAMNVQEPYAFESEADMMATVQAVAADTSVNFSSTLQDVRAGNRTEMPFMNGYLCRVAERFGIDVPLNKELLGSLGNHFTSSIMNE